LSLGETASLTAIGTADLSRPTNLSTCQDVAAVQQVYRRLAGPTVQGDGALQTALRRLVFAGSRSLAEDRLVDLMTAAEALFVQRYRIEGRSKGGPIADGASQLLDADPELAVDSPAINEFMKKAYKLRNAEIHGDEPKLTKLTHIDGSEAATLDAVVADIETVMRRSVYLVLANAECPR
jgi:hypothetical protein